MEKVSAGLLVRGVLGALVGEGPTWDLSVSTGQYWVLRALSVSTGQYGP